MSKKNYQKSAKDIAFDKERACFRKQIRELATQIRAANRQLEVYEETIRQKDEWISRLLEYMDLSEEELKKFIESEKKKTEIVEHLHDMNRALGRLGMFGGML